MLHNTPEMVEAHYAVPALNAVLNTLNTRLDAPLLAWQMNHCEARGADHRPRVRADDRRGAAHAARASTAATPVVIDVCDSEYAGAGERLGAHEYEALLAAHEPLAALDGPARRVGRDRRQLHLAARPATRRASSPTTAAPT